MYVFLPRAFPTASSHHNFVCQVSSKIITGAAGQQLHVRKSSQVISTLVRKQILGTSRVNVLTAALSPEEPRCALRDQWPQKAALK